MAQLNDLIVMGRASFLNEIKGKIDWTNINNKPTIPTVNNATLTIQKNGTNVQTFTANQSTNATANITVPTKVSELTNDSGYTSNVGTITGIKMNGASKGTSGVVDLGTVITAHQDISGKADKAFTLDGYGITDATIVSGTIVLGSNTITPLTSSSTLDATKLSGTIPSECYTDTNVTQTDVSSDSRYRSLLFSSDSATSSTNTGTVLKSNYVRGNLDGNLYLSNANNYTTKLSPKYIKIGEHTSYGSLWMGVNNATLEYDITLSGSNQTWDGTNTSLKSAISSINSKFDADTTYDGWIATWNSGVLTHITKDNLLSRGVGYAQLLTKKDSTVYTPNSTNIKFTESNITCTFRNAYLFKSDSVGTFTVLKTGLYLVCSSLINSAVSAAGKVKVLGLWDKTTNSFIASGSVISRAETWEHASICGIATLTANHVYTLGGRSEQCTSTVSDWHIIVIPVSV